MSFEKTIIIKSVYRSVLSARMNGNLDLKTVYLYDILRQYFDYTSNNKNFKDQHDCIRNLMNKIRMQNPKDICNFKTILPRTITREANREQDTGIIIGEFTLSGSNFTVGTNKQTLFGIGNTVDTYSFKKSDFLAAFRDNNDGQFHSVFLLMDGGTGGAFRYRPTPTTGSLYGDTRSPIEIPIAQLEQWSFYSTSTTEYIHQINFKFTDVVNGVKRFSNVVELTVNRSNSVANLPPTIGDITLTTGNRSVIVITLAMVTTSLTPPYNDPEGDLIDAVRLKEISTANKGRLVFNGLTVNEGDIIIRQNIEAGMLTYEAPDDDSIWGDTFRFEVRDEGNGTWVE